MAAGADLPIPDSLQAAVADRVLALPATTRGPLLACALLADPTIEVVDAVAGADGLDPAFGAGVLELVDGRVRFSHPLLAAAVRAAATPGRRRAMHARLAKALPAGEQRVRHLA